MERILNLIPDGVALIGNTNTYFYNKNIMNAFDVQQKSDVKKMTQNLKRQKKDKAIDDFLSLDDDIS